MLEYEKGARFIVLCSPHTTSPLTPCAPTASNGLRPAPHKEGARAWHVNGYGMRSVQQTYIMAHLQQAECRHKSDNNSPHATSAERRRLETWH